SNFDEDRQWGTFPAVSAAWRISEEKFMDGLDFVSDLKIRASHGTVANLANIDFYASRALVGVGANYIQAAGLAPSQLGNPNLTWEKARQTDIALELGFLNRFNLTVEGYSKTTTDLLQTKPLVATSGFTGVFTNVGELENKGLEFTLNTQNIRKQNFTWTTDFNLTFQKNKIKKLEGGVPFAQGFASWVQEGESIGAFRGYRVVGIFQSADQIAASPFQSTATRPGDIQFADLNGDNAITAADQEILGNALPKFFGGLTNNITYKGFELNAFLQFVSGNKIYNNTRAFAEGMNSIFGQFATVRDRWTPDKTNATLPRAVFGDPANNRRTSDRWIEDGSFMRLKNVVLSYGLPSSLTSRFKISSLRFFVQGQNLITWTDYSGFDPEVSTFSITNTSPGTDFLTYPQARTITFGLNLGF
ncbi:MAG TPA: SusC/RagA family TonB-linked outer membrane protein, partial [Flavisolibacter sp.]|nr:SusC/RagA family TonB-linked outer membrane protein [Flavisolibacter sp.]